MPNKPGEPDTLVERVMREKGWKKIDKPTSGRTLIWHSKVIREIKTVRIPNIFSFPMLVTAKVPLSFGYMLLLIKINNGLLNYILNLY